MMHGQAISDNEIYLLIKYIKSVLWRVAKRLSYIEDAQCLNFNELRVIEACGRTRGIALPTLNGGPVYYSQLNVRLF